MTTHGRAQEQAALALFERLLAFINAEPDPAEAAYDCWVHLTHILAEGGWTAEELSCDAKWHAQNQYTHSTPAKGSA